MKEVSAVSSFTPTPPPNQLAASQQSLSRLVAPGEVWGGWGEASRLTLWNRHFRVVASLCFKARLSAKLLVWKWLRILMQIKLIFTRKVLHLALLWKWEIFGTRKWPVWNKRISFKGKENFHKGSTAKVFFLRIFTLELFSVSSKRLLVSVIAGLVLIVAVSVNIVHVRKTLETMNINYQVKKVVEDGRDWSGSERTLFQG